MSQMAGLGEDENLPRNRTLDFIEFPAKIFDEHIVQPLIDLGRFFANEFETFVQSVSDLGRDQLTRTERLFDLWVLRSLTQFLVNFLASFRAMMQLAQHGETQFLRGFNGHTILDSFHQFRFPVGIHAANVRALSRDDPSLARDSISFGLQLAGATT